MRRSSINFKKVCEYISEYSIIVFGVLIILKYFVDLGFWNSSDFTNILIIIYLASSLYFYEAESKDLKEKISTLESKLEQKDKSNL